MKQNKIAAISLILLLVAAGLAAGLLYSKSAGKGEELPNAAEESYSPIITGTTGQGDVAIELTPKQFNGKKLEVAISANTHSVNLDVFDLKQLTTLEYDGKAIRPETAPQLGGHHSSGVLVFGVNEPVDRFTIKIKGIPAVDERVFKWG